MTQYTIPNVFHFVWFGSDILSCETTLKAWRELHPEATINLWLSTDATFNQESGFISELKKITVRYIEEETGLNANYLIIKKNGLNARNSIIEAIRLDTDQLMMDKSSFDASNPIIEWTGTVEENGIAEETGLDSRDLTIEELCLNNRDLILEEVKKKRYWSASDIARFAILNKEPGFYFDIGVIPKQSLLNTVCGSSGFSLAFGTTDYFGKIGIYVHYKLFCSAYPSHPFFTQILPIIHSIFTSLHIDPTPEKYFYTEFDNLISLFYLNLTSQEEASYLFARVVTGDVAIRVLSEHSIHNEKKRLLTINSKFHDCDFYFKYGSYLQISPVKDSGYHLTEYEPLCRNSYWNAIVPLSQRINHPLADKLNAIYKLDTNEKEQFFCLQNMDQNTFLIAHLDQNE